MPDHIGMGMTISTRGTRGHPPVSSAAGMGLASQYCEAYPSPGGSLDDFEEVRSCRRGAGRMTEKPNKTKGSPGAVGLLHRRHAEDEPAPESIPEEQRGEAEVARLVHDLRTQAGLTQKELADRVGTTPSAISRLEDADYGGHSLAMLRRIAAAMRRRVQIRFIPIGSPPRRVASRRGAMRLPDPPAPAQEICARSISPGPVGPSDAGSETPSIGCPIPPSRSRCERRPCMSSIRRPSRSRKGISSTPAPSSATTPRTGWRPSHYDGESASSS